MSLVDVFRRGLIYTSVSSLKNNGAIIMIKKSLTLAGLVTALVFSSSAMAYKSKYTHDGCKKPQFKNLQPEAYNSDTKIETEPEAEISFTVSSYIEPASINIVAKKIPLKYKHEFKDSFYRITAKLPAELTGKYVRINVDATALMGCVGKDGWLIKVKE